MKKTVRIAANLDMGIAVISLAALIAVTFINVIMRRCFNRPFMWQEEVQLWLIVWVVCYGSSAAFRSGGHVVVDMVIEMLPDVLQNVVKWIVWLIVTGVMGYLLYSNIIYLEQLFTTNRVTNILKIPYGFIYSAFPVSIVYSIAGFTGYCWMNRKNRGEGENI